MRTSVAAHARRHLLVFVLAAVWLGSNLLKPLTVDDAAYYEYARQIAVHPADPYGFTILWYQTRQPAIEVLAPPVWVYWWGAGVRCFGDHEWAWKLWQFPLVYLFVAAFAALARRLVQGPAADLLPVLMVLSPVFLPGLNLMTDVPALALALAGVALFVRASDRESAGEAALAGLVVGFAMQTKYTAGLVPAAMALYAAYLGRVRLALVAAGTAVAVFVSWEAAMLWRYGQSQFLASLVESGGEVGRKWSLVPALVTLAGGAGSAWGFFALTALGVRRSVVALAMLAGAVAFVTFGWMPARMPVSLPGAVAATLGRPAIHVNPYLDLCRVLGAVVVVAIGFVVVRLRREADRADMFLMAWLALEIVGYLLLNPFVAVRRLMGPAVPATLLIGRLAGRTCISLERRRLLLLVAGYGALLAILFAITDRADATVQRDGAIKSAEIAHAHADSSGARVWYVGHWGFQYYAERASMKPVVPGSSRLRKGDLLVAPDAPVDVQRVLLQPSDIGLVAEVALEDDLPWRTIPGYYRGAVPMSSRPPGPRLKVRVYRVTHDLVPEPFPAR